MVKINKIGLMQPFLSKKTKNHIIKNITFPRSLKKIINIIEMVSHHRLYQKYAPYTKLIKTFHHIHEGDRCFIIGTGPSLNKTNFKLIQNEQLIGVNTLFTGLNKFQIKPQYWVISDPYVFEAHYKQVLNVNTKLFLTSGAGHMYLNRKDEFSSGEKIQPIVIKRLGRGTLLSDFSKDLTKGVFASSTVVFHALQIAYYMGFTEVYLLGCDCDYSISNYFDNTGKVRPDNAEMDIHRVFSGYERAKWAFEKDNRKIYNATVGGKLEVFKRKSLEEVFA